MGLPQLGQSRPAAPLPSMLVFNRCVLDQPAPISAKSVIIIHKPSDISGLKPRRLS